MGNTEIEEIAFGYCMLRVELSQPLFAANGKPDVVRESLLDPAPIICHVAGVVAASITPKEVIIAYDPGKIDWNELSEIDGLKNEIDWTAVVPVV